MSVLVVLHCGFLEKEKSESFLGGWNKRWFTLDSDSLCYYREKSDTVAADTIKLLNIVAVVDGPGNCDFQFTTAQRTYRMRAESSTERSVWINSLQNVILTAVSAQKKLASLSLALLSNTTSFSRPTSAFDPSNFVDCTIPSVIQSARQAAHVVIHCGSRPQSGSSLAMQPRDACAELAVTSSIKASVRRLDKVAVHANTESSVVVSLPTATVHPTQVYVGSELIAVEADLLDNWDDEETATQNINLHSSSGGGVLADENWIDNNFDEHV